MGTELVHLRSCNPSNKNYIGRFSSCTAQLSNNSISTQQSMHFSCIRRKKEEQKLTQKKMSKKSTTTMFHDTFFNWHQSKQTLWNDFIHTQIDFFLSFFFLFFFLRLQLSGNKGNIHSYPQTSIEDKRKRQNVLMSWNKSTIRMESK